MPLRPTLASSSSPPTGVGVGSRRTLRPLYLLLALLILGLTAYVRLAHRADNPGWYTDEGTHLAIAQQLLQGRVQYLALNQSTLLAGRLPLFDLLLAGLLRVGGDEMSLLRALTGSLGVVSVGLLHWATRRATRDPALALLAALMLAIYPRAVLYSRFGFSYNLLTPLVLLAYLGLYEYLNTTRRGWLALAALSIGVGAISDLLTWTFLAPLAVVISARRQRDLLWALPLSALPFIGLYATPMLVSAPQAFLFDSRFILSRLSAASLPQQFATLADNYATLLSQDGWIVCGLIGLFLIQPARLGRLSLLFFLLPLTLMGRSLALYSLSAYYLIPLLPFLALGLAALIRYGAPHVWKVVSGALSALLNRWGYPLNEPKWKLPVTAGAAILCGLLIATPFVMSIKSTLEQARNRFSTGIDEFLINPADARAAAAFVNHRVNADDLIIASPGLAWLLHGHVADFQVAMAAEGQATAHLPADIPADRFAFDARYTQARFVVVDNLWRNWAAVNIPAVAEMLQVVESWPLVFQVGEIAVHRNPARSD